MTIKKSSDIKIAVMGPTGTGKSSLIQHITGDTSIKIGHGIESATSEIGPYRIQRDGRWFTFVDTPGFDSSTRGLTDAALLRQIGSFLEKEYKEEKPTLNGIIYMHRINDPRVGQINIRNLKMFQKLCGVDSLRNVVIVTTYWDQIGESEGSKREKELMASPQVFKPFVDAQAHFFRHDGSFKSAQKITQDLFVKNPITLKIQRELASGTKIKDTEAGLELSRKMNGIVKQLEEEIKNLRIEVDDAVSKKDEELTLKARERLTSTIKKWDASKWRLEYWNSGSSGAAPPTNHSQLEYQSWSSPSLRNEEPVRQTGPGGLRIGKMQGGAGGQGGKALAEDGKGGIGGAGGTARINHHGENPEMNIGEFLGGVGGAGGEAERDAGAGGHGGQALVDGQDETLLPKCRIPGKDMHITEFGKKYAVNDKVVEMLIKAGYETTGSLRFATIAELKEENFKNGHINQVRNGLDRWSPK